MRLHFRTGQWDEACDMVERFHYSRRIPSNVQFVCSLHEDGGLFGDAGRMAAAAFFSIPPTRWSEDVLELSRLVRRDGIRADLSSLISQATKHIKAEGGNLIVSFADKTHGHFGGVYQACSWLYAGARERRMDGCLIDGTFMPGRSCNSRYGTRSPEKLSALLRKPVVGSYDEGKHLYFKPLNVRGKTKAKRLGLKSLPYPKDNADGPQDEPPSRRCEAGATPEVRSNAAAPRGNQSSLSLVPRGQLPGVSEGASGPFLGGAE